MADSIRVAHLSDSHLGYEAYPALAASGINQRGQDVVKAFMNSVIDIERWDPPLVIHSGDLAERAFVSVRYMLVARQALARLAGVRADGTRRQVVIIAGNHDQPHFHKEACFLELYRDIPGVHVVTTRYDQIRFGTAEAAAPELRDVVVHSLPHSVLKSVDFELVQPLPGKTNILTAHGVAGGSELFRRALGREYAIPTDVLSRAWDYVALGHWHKQGPVPLISAGANKSDDVGRCWYAGSTENMGFGDLRDNGTRRGYLRVALSPGAMPEVVRQHLPIRSMFRLPVLEGQGLTPAEIGEALKNHIRQGNVTGAVVGQIVTGVTRDIWSLVDKEAVRRAASGALHYDLAPSFAAVRAADAAAGDSSRGVLGDLGALLEQTASELLSADERGDALVVARNLLGSALEDMAAGGEGAAAASVAEEEAA